MVEPVVDRPASSYPWGAERKPRPGDEFELDLEQLEEGGEVSGAVDGYRVRVRHGSPGSRVRVRARRRRRNRVEADILQLLEPAPHSVDARCRHFGTCGGCSFQGLSYGYQLEELRGLAQRQLEALAGAPGAELPEVEPVLGADDPWNYRNKMDFTFSNRRWVEDHEPEGVRADFALGLHVRGRHEKVLDIAGCDIAFSGCSEIRRGARELAGALGLSAWDNRRHAGLLRHLVLRHSLATNEVLVHLVTAPTSGDEAQLVREYAHQLIGNHPSITTLVSGARSAVSSVAATDEDEVLYGSGFIHDDLAGVRMRLSPASFFQTNSAQAQVLARVVVDETNPAPTDVLYDICCGAGAWGLVLAPRVAQVWGFELAESAVADARHNASANGIESARFIEGDVATTLAAEELARQGVAGADVAIVDPPRAGLHPRALRALRELAPRRIVYVSCRLPSAVRDIAALLPDGYRLRRVRPVDLFPHTPHLECVLTLERE